MGAAYEYPESEASYDSGVDEAELIVLSDH